MPVPDIPVSFAARCVPVLYRTVAYSTGTGTVLLQGKNESHDYNCENMKSESYHFACVQGARQDATFAKETMEGMGAWLLKKYTVNSLLWLRQSSRKEMR